MEGFENIPQQESENQENKAENSAEQLKNFKGEFEGTVSALEELLFRFKQRQNEGYVEFIDDEHGSLFAGAIEKAKGIDIASPEDLDTAAEILEVIDRCISTVEMQPSRRMVDDVESLARFSWDMKTLADAAGRLDSALKRLYEFDAEKSDRLFQVSNALTQHADEMASYINHKAQALEEYNNSR